VSNIMFLIATKKTNKRFITDAKISYCIICVFHFLSINNCHIRNSDEWSCYTLSFSYVLFVRSIFFTKYFLHIHTLKINMSYIFQKSTQSQRKEQTFLLLYLLTEFNKPTNLLFLSRFIYMSKHLDDDTVKLKNKSFRSIISIR
jgi:hypothetical protein